MKPSELKNISKLMEKRAKITEDFSMYLATSQVVVLHMRHPKFFETNDDGELWKNQCNKLLDDITLKTKELKEYLNNDSGGDSSRNTRPSLSLKLISKHYTDDDMDHLNLGYVNGIDSKETKDTLKRTHSNISSDDHSDVNSDTSTSRINGISAENPDKHIIKDVKVMLQPITLPCQMPSNNEEDLLDELLKVSDISDDELEFSDIAISSESDEKPEPNNRKRKKTKRKVGTTVDPAHNLLQFTRNCFVNLIRFDVKLYESYIAKHKKIKLAYLTEFLMLTKKRKRTLSSSSNSSLSSVSTILYPETEATSLQALSGNNSYDQMLFSFDQKPLDPEDEMIAAMNQITDSDTSALDSDFDSDSDSKKKNKIDKVKKKTKKKNVISSDMDSDFEPEIIKPSNSSWRRDPLLRENLDFDEKKTDQKERDPLKIEDLEEPEEMKTPSRESTPDEDSTDSDIDFVPVKDGTSTSVESDVDSDVECLGDVILSPAKGRKNIRPMLNDEALHEATQKANKIEQEKRKRVAELKNSVTSFVQSQSSGSELNGLLLDVDKVSMKPIVIVNANLSNRLKDHQQEGVKFMWNACFEKVEMISKNEGSGCILAHCMGLGKTFQVTTLVHTLFAYPATKVKHVLIICPLSTVPNWNHEFVLTNKIAEGGAFKVFYKSRLKINLRTIVLHWRAQGGVLIIGYDAFNCLLSRKKKKVSLPDSTVKALEEALRNPGPDLLVCDEGHLLKNQQKIKYKSVDRIMTKRRIILTGTPIQNNLTEYYYMVQLIKPSLLGTFVEFTNRFNNPIVNGQYGDSTIADIKIMKQRSHVLHEILKDTVQRYEESELNIYLPAKVDYALYIQMNEVQASLYGDVLSKLRSNHDPQKKMGDFISHYQKLMPLWMHPCIAFTKQNNKKPVQYETITLDNLDEDVIDLTPDLEEKFPSDVESNIEYGAKFVIIMAIIDECLKLGDRLLIFSTSLFTLDTIEKFLKFANRCNDFQWKKNHTYFRLDGQVHPNDRVDITIKFNDKKSNARLMLMTNKVGGLGLNLVAANRVILADISWNPALDTQSIFRSYRFGQEKPVYIYRLVARGTMEETVYRRAVTKVAIAGRVVDEQQIDRHYKSVDLKEIYRFQYNKEEVRPIPKVPTDDLLATLLQTFPALVFGYDEHNSLFLNRPDEELNVEEMKEAWVEFNKERAPKPVPQLVPIVPIVPATTAVTDPLIMNHRFLDDFLPPNLTGISIDFLTSIAQSNLMKEINLNRTLNIFKPPANISQRPRVTPAMSSATTSTPIRNVIPVPTILNAKLTPNLDLILPHNETLTILNSGSQNALKDIWLSKNRTNLPRLPANILEKHRVYNINSNNSSEFFVRKKNSVDIANYKPVQRNTVIMPAYNTQPNALRAIELPIYQSHHNKALNNQRVENVQAEAMDMSTVDLAIAVGLNKTINPSIPTDLDQETSISTPVDIDNISDPLSTTATHSIDISTTEATHVLERVSSPAVALPEDFVVNPFLPTESTAENQENNIIYDEEVVT